MLKPVVIRIFFAIDLPSSLKDTLKRYLTALRKESKKEAIRWTKPENLHITLHFLPELNSEHLPLLIDNVQTQLQKGSMISPLSFGELQFFPNAYRPRVIVLEVLPHEVLEGLAKTVGQGILASAYPIETRPFRGHLTLGRIKQTHRINLDFLSGVRPPKVPPFAMQEVVLFKSEPGVAGSQYTVLKRFELLPMVSPRAQIL